MRKPDPAQVLAACESVPRYTSYPTAPHFKPGEGERLMEALLAAIDGPVSAYIHIPYCDRLCWFCGCHTKHTLKYGPVTEYVDHLVRETGLLADKLGRKPLLERLHLGGGSPSLLRTEDLARIRAALAATFDIAGDAEISIEIDPSDHGAGSLDGFAALGVTRASIGVQDFAPQVQAAINRPQTFEATRDVIASLRSHGVESINIDALYGLPLQTMDTLRATIRQVIDLAPDRVALFGYAHVPWVKKHQQMIREEDLPGQVERFHQAEAAEEVLIDAGYAKIGIDHFALPGDGLARAAREGRLRRNFQGYTTDECATLIGLGGSSISAFEGGFVQNIVATGQYQACVAEGRLPASRGCERTLDDRIRGHVIERLMCDFALDLGDLERRFGVSARTVVLEARKISAMETQGLCALDGDVFRIPEAARAFTRIVASRFDAYLPDSMFRYSRAV